MNTKRLSLSVLVAVAMGFSALADAATSPPAAPETAPSATHPGGMMSHGGGGMMGQGGMGMMGMMGMSNCPMSGTHLSGKDAMLMRADMIQAMSSIMRKYADRAQSAESPVER